MWISFLRRLCFWRFWHSKRCGDHILVANKLFKKQNLQRRSHILYIWTRPYIYIYMFLLSLSARVRAALLIAAPNSNQRNFTTAICFVCGRAECCLAGCLIVWSFLKHTNLVIYGLLSIAFCSVRMYICFTSWICSLLLQYLFNQTVLIRFCYT